jgi:hypothetical protein
MYVSYHRADHPTILSSNNPGSGIINNKTVTEKKTQADLS